MERQKPMILRQDDGSKQFNSMEMERIQRYSIQIQLDLEQIPLAWDQIRLAIE
jgi:hypothetical protein